MKKIKRALISCTDKTGIDVFAKFLQEQGVEILSTGGTAAYLRKANIPVVEVSDFTGFPEMLDGRVKTLHPKIHGGILGIRANKTHQRQMAENNIEPIDLLVINLYAFEKTISNPQSTIHDAIENIDIGGPALMRSAAKNYHDVVIISDPADYAVVMTSLKETGTVSEACRFELASKVFERTAAYDKSISQYLKKQAASVITQEASAVLPATKTIQLTKVQDLRYGENPHQKAALYCEEPASFGVLSAVQLQGKELSFNNYMDMESAWSCAREFGEPACVIVKHMNPCGVAVARLPHEAFLRARQGDPVSSFGGIVALNRAVDKPTALVLAETFFEVIIAPGYDAESEMILSKKKNLRLMSFPGFSDPKTTKLDYRKISGGLLIQQSDEMQVDVSTCECVTRRKPTRSELADLSFAWQVVKHVKSNAIVYAKDKQILGVGAGQMSRVDSVMIAARKACESFQSETVLQNAVMASDAFFPFRDGVDIAAKNGIKAIVQPGGSMRDQEVITACDEHDIAMLLTHIRHFRH